MTPEINNTPPNNSERMHEKLIAEIRTDLAYEHTEDDTLQYVALSTGIRSLLLSSQNAAKGIDRELTLDDARKEGDPQKLTPEERIQYENYLTEVHSWTFLLPHLLRTTRGIQYSPDVSAAMQRLTDDLQKTLDLGASMEKARMGIIMRSQIDMAGRTIEELAGIATFEWLRRTTPPPTEQVKQDPALLKEHLKSIGILQQQEQAYKREMTETGESQSNLRETTDEERTLEGTARITQGYPGAEMLLDRPEVSLQVWKRLLLEGGPRERSGGATQFREVVESFQKNFLQKEALRAFESDVHTTLQKLVVANAVEKEKSKKILGFLLGDFGDAVVERLTTHPEEFQVVEDAIMLKVREAFDVIAKPEHEAATEELLQVLQEMETGKTVDTNKLSQLMEKYMNIQVQNRDVMAAVQRWQVASNAERVGGRGEQGRAAQMIDQLTRPGEGQSGIEWIRRMAPYGSFQTRGYVSPNGRFVLLPASDNRFSEQGPLGHIKEVSKAAGTLLTTRVIYYIVLKAVTRGSAAAGTLVAIVEAEIVMTLLKGAAHQEIIGRGARRIAAVVQDLQALEQGKDREGQPVDPRLRKELARQAGNELFSALLTMLQAAKAENFTLLSERDQATPKPPDVLEAHLYANQILNAFGFPGYHQVPDGMPLPAADDQTLSPEVRQYLTMRKGPDREGIQKKTRAQLEAFRMYEDRLLNPPPGPDAAREKTRNQRSLESPDLPALRTKEELKDLLQTSEFSRSYATFEKSANRADVLKKVGGWVGFKSQIDEALLPFRHPTGAQRAWRGIASELFGASAPTAREIIGEKKIAEWQPQMKAIQETTLQDFLNHIRYLQKNPPTNAEIAAWYDDAGVSGIGDRQINAFYGQEGERGLLVDRLLTAWMELHASALQYGEEQK